MNLELFPTTPAEILAYCKEREVRFVRLQFMDIPGVSKNVEIPVRQLEKALDGQILFDGSSIEGFVRIEESDMQLRPDPATFHVLPWGRNPGEVGVLICDVVDPDGNPFDGCPRTVLRRVVDQAAELGFTPMLGPEPEFFLFERDAQGAPTVNTRDRGTYFDLGPIDRGEACRRDIVAALEAMGFEIEASHHEVGEGQHEIDFRYDEAIATADKIAVFKNTVRRIALEHELHATFMPKPVNGRAGSGMHVHQSLFKGKHNAFEATDNELGLSPTALHYIGGLLQHARGMMAVTNPLVNSYKRMVPGHEAPTSVVWSTKNRSPLIRIPARRGTGTRVELRMPDPSCNPYLAFAVMIGAGLEGIRQKLDPGEPVNKNIFTMSHREKRRLRIDELPENLGEALRMLGKDPLMRTLLGDHAYHNYVEARSMAWQEYSRQVHPWELERYLARY
ncbi:glutamine synthetase [Acidobacteria bacterium Mor1]|nr:glutamine synthetase [Acidobacteria bacterium Mor1]